MKLPNFRLYTTQATTGLLAGLAGLACLGMLAACVFYNFQPENMIIPYNPEGRGQYRFYLVMGLTGTCLLIGAIAGVMGFRSMGEKRNTRQGHSWAGLALGTLIIPAAIVLCHIWRTLSEGQIVR